MVTQTNMGLSAQLPARVSLRAPPWGTLVPFHQRTLERPSPSGSLLR